MHAPGTRRSRALAAAMLGSLLAGLALAFASGLASDDPPAAADARTSEANAFRAPDAKGWGRAGGLDYLEFVRGGAKPTEALPMIVLIHGLGDAPHDGWLDLIADDVRARIILPRAPQPWGGSDGWAWFPFRVGDHANSKEQLAKHLDTRARQLAAALDLLRSKRPTLGAPIVAGFSQGGMLSFALAARHPDRYSFVLPISGLLPESLWPERAPAAAARVPIRAVHGARDTVVPIEPARAFVQHLKKLGYDANLTEFPGLGHSIDRDLRTHVMRDLAAAVRNIRTTQR